MTEAYHLSALGYLVSLVLNRTHHWDNLDLPDCRDALYAHVGWT